MTDLQRLESAITHLLCDHDCVVVPNLGAFLLRSFSASANPFSGELKPSGQTLFFNPSISTDDGLLLTHWRHITGCDYNTAQHSVQELVKLISEQVKINRSYPFGKIGNFFLHSDNKLLFLPSSSVNLSKHAFGLESFVIEASESLRTPHKVVPLVNAEPVSESISVNSEQEIDEAEVIELKVNHPRSNGFIWKIAASICIVSLSVAAIYYGKFFNKSKQQVQVASHIPSMSNATNPSESIESATHESNKKTNAFVSLLTPDDMNKGMEHIKIGKGSVFICGGSYMSLKLAENECNSWKKNGIPAIIGKKSGSSLVKVVVGRFDNEESASAFLEQMPVNTGFHAGLLTAKLQFD